MDMRIARFHNVYGAGGSWNDGREKAPAAMLRKAIALKSSPDANKQLEIWGDGRQRRSFLFIDDAVEGVIKLLNSSEKNPVNIGSDSAVTIDHLAKLALKSVGLDSNNIAFDYHASKPIGVSSRNSNNDLASTVLGWQPSTPLEVGLARTGLWIQQQMDVAMAMDDQHSNQAEFLTSKLLNLESVEVVFGLLLPITSRGRSNPSDCLDNLHQFARSLIRTTWRDVHERGATRYRFTVYLAIDRDDSFLNPNDPESDQAAKVLREEHVYDLVTIICDHPRGHICKIWRDCAKKTFEGGCHYFVLMGDDVVLKDEGWMRDTQAIFVQLATTAQTPFGFGCVAFTDLTFPGMPTFPIIHRTHMIIYEGDVLPDAFLNQDGDPFIFQLYRRWGCFQMFPCRISNGVGGGDDCRYEKKHAEDWTYEVLDSATMVAESWLVKQVKIPIQRKLTLDIVVPCYRVGLSILDTIPNPKPSATCSTMFIIIIDNPVSPAISGLESRYGHRPDVRIRVNKTNLGASASRDRGIEESAAEWVHFLDGDVVPEDDILIRAEEVIRRHPEAAGFVGNSVFPVASTIFTTAVHLAGVTYFWDIAAKRKDDRDLPWVVTANLIAR